MWAKCKWALLIALVICLIFDVVTRHFWLLLTDSLMAIAVLIIVWGVRQLGRLNKPE